MKDGLLPRLKQRKVVQFALAYLAGAWLILQVMDVFGEGFGWSTSSFRVVVFTLGIGFFITIILAWYHGEQGRQRVSGPELLMLAGILVIGVGVLELVRRTSPATAGSEKSSGMLLQEPAPAGSIAVLPFVDLSEKRDQEYFSDGLTEELLNALAQVTGLRVAARTSSFVFKGEHHDIRRIGQQLGVATVLEGSVRRSGRRLKITAQLISAADGYHLWSQTFDREAEDIFAVQEEISRAVVLKLLPRLTSESPDRVVRPTTTNLHAHELYLRGTHALDQAWNEADLRMAIALLEDAIRADPRYALAHARLSYGYSMLGFLRPPREAYPIALQHARHALELDPELAEGYVALAEPAFAYDWDFEEADRLYRRAIELNPLLAVACMCYANLLAITGKTSAAVREAERARSLDPLSQLTSFMLGWVYQLAGREQDGTRVLRGVVAQDSTSFYGATALAMLARDQLDYDAAVRALERLQLDMPPAWLTELAYSYTLAGRPGDAARVLDRLEQRPGNLKYIGLIHGALGNADEAFRWLERAVAEREDLSWLLMLDASKPLLRDPRYDALMRKVGLVPIHRSAAQPPVAD